MISSSTAVRTIIGQAKRVPPMAVAIRSPTRPASRRAYGSLKIASGRSDSKARYIATQRAVSEM